MNNYKIDNSLQFKRIKTITHLGNLDHEANNGLNLRKFNKRIVSSQLDGLFSANANSQAMKARIRFGSQQAYLKKRHIGRLVSGKQSLKLTDFRDSRPLTLFNLAALMLHFGRHLRKLTLQLTLDKYPQAHGLPRLMKSLTYLAQLTQIGIVLDECNLELNSKFLSSLAKSLKRLSQLNELTFSANSAEFNYRISKNYLAT